MFWHISIWCLRSFSQFLMINYFRTIRCERSKIRRSFLKVFNFWIQSFFAWNLMTHCLVVKMFTLVKVFKIGSIKCITHFLLVDRSCLKFLRLILESILNFCAFKSRSRLLSLLLLFFTDKVIVLILYSCRSAVPWPLSRGLNRRNRILLFN